MFAKTAAIVGATSTALIGWYAHGLHRRLHTDPLTGLANRPALQRAFTRLQRRARPGELVGLLLCDLDDFKTINDVHGHRIGDEVLCSVAADLAGLTAGTRDLAVRLSGDEFAVLLPGLDEVRDAEGTARRYREALTTERVIDGRPMQIGASIGAAVDTAAVTSLSALLEHADLRMYRIKREHHLTRLPADRTAQPTARRRDLPKEAA
ncbi:GGDEF domain-containing protein [Saccharopolyspora indica]|uniref:GGDEF domain-containing protein n=1 Tax=Saccharopolyspora indica TaxID=1229659 RepID=UPI0022EA2CFC|nr:GGDEF domain-containing protein [Saccharopolyspora indica]MDA3644167.1 GGDEF domain-containing protein [Saccharopolyspora indica]